MIMSNKDIEEYHNIGLDTATKVFNKFKDGTLDYLELDLNFNDYKVKTEFNSSLLIKFLKSMSNSNQGKVPSLNLLKTFVAVSNPML